MAVTQFKLIEPNGLTRRIAFSTPPSWQVLATKIGTLYGIPIKHVAVTYQDSEGDQVTLSTQEELDDYYRLSYTRGKTIKFTVQDLTSARSQKISLEAPYDGKGHNPFSGNIEDDWQSLPIPTQPLSTLFGTRSPAGDVPHAFLESVDSDATIQSVHQPKAGDSTAHSSPQSPFIASRNKGKGKDVDDELEDVLSTASVLANSSPRKHPVHVYDMGSCNTEKPSASSVTEPLKVSLLNMTAQENAVTQEPSKVSEAAGSDPALAVDPPLAPGDPNPSPSLSNDIAVLLHAFNRAIGGHPELSEGIRNIIQNASNGTYWVAHRQAVSQAAQEFVGTADQLRKDAEAEAARRVAGALGAVLQNISQVSGASGGQPPASVASVETNPTPPAQSEDAKISAPSDHPPQPRRPFLPAGRPSWAKHSWRMSMPPSSFAPRPFTGHQAHAAVHGGPDGPPFPVPLPAAWHLGSLWPSPHVPPPVPVTTSPAAPFEHDTMATGRELKAQFDEVKARYKAEKERYRHEKEQFRKVKAEVGVQLSQVATPMKQSTIQPSTPAAITTPNFPDSSAKLPAAIAVQGKGGNPTLEVVSVQRYNTFPGRAHGRHIGRGHGDFTTRTTNRIIRRLADMGFTENAHPNLAAKVKAQLPASGVLTNDAEDNVVTTLLEDLLATSPKPKLTSRPGENIPGAWY